MLPTNLLYKTMSLKEYNEALSPYVTGLAQGYTNKSTPEKWDIVMERMKRLAPHMAEKFESFRKTRKQTDASLFNLSLADCLNYFENFAFLYETEDARFKLSAHQKGKLLEGIDDAMGTCETGINTRFELVLQQFRTDLNWVTNILAKYRYQLIIGLQDAYNEKFTVGDALKTHTLKRMMHLASEQYGIAIEHTMMDVFAHLTDRSGIADYFEKNAPRVFKAEYEDQVVEILAQDLLLKIKALYCPQECDWTQTELVINQADVNEFSNFVVGNRLDLPAGTIYQLGTLDDADEDGEGNERVPTYNFHVKNQGEMLDVLRGLIKQKLLKEQYFLSFAELTRENLPNLRKLELRGIDVADLVELKEALDQLVEHPEKAAKLLQQHQTFLLKHPDLLAETLQTHPQLLRILPRAMKQNISFVEKLLPAISKAILVKVEEDAPEIVEELSTYLTPMIKNSPELVAKIPQELFAVEAFAKRLVSQNGLFLDKLPEHLRDQADIVEAAVRQNSLALLKAPEQFQVNDFYVALALQGKHFKSLGWTANFAEAGAFVLAQGIEKVPYSLRTLLPMLSAEQLVDVDHLSAMLDTITAVHQLATQQTNLSLAEVSKLAQCLSPDQLLKIVQYRKEQDYAPLPYFTESGLTSFKDKLIASGFQWKDWNKEKESLRKLASEQIRYNAEEDPYGYSATSYFANSENWFVAMVQHQQSTSGAFKNGRQIWLQLKKFIDELLALIYQIGKFILIASLGITLSSLVNHLVFTLLPAWVGLVMLACIIAPFFSSLIHNRNYTIASSILSTLSIGILLLDDILAVSTAIYAFFKLISLSVQAFHLLGTGFEFLSRGFQTLFMNNDPVQAVDADLHTKCENSITRLELMDNPSAQEKAEVMQDILDKIDAELTMQGPMSDERREIELARNLTKTYNVAHAGKSHKLSFYQAAAVTRSDFKPLDLDTPRDVPYFSFFRTSTTNTLPDEAELRRTIETPVAV